MNFLREKSGKLSHKRIISLCLIIVSIVMGFLLYPIEYIYFFGGIGILNIGMTVYKDLKNGKRLFGDPDNPPPDDEEPPP